MEVGMRFARSASISDVSTIDLDELYARNEILVTPGPERELEEDCIDLNALVASENCKPGASTCTDCVPIVCDDKKHKLTAHSSRIVASTPSQNRKRLHLNRPNALALTSTSAPQPIAESESQVPEENLRHQLPSNSVTLPNVNSAKPPTAAADDVNANPAGFSLQDSKKDRVHNSTKPLTNVSLTNTLPSPVRSSLFVTVSAWPNTVCAKKQLQAAAENESCLRQKLISSAAVDTLPVSDRSELFVSRSGAWRLQLAETTPEFRKSSTVTTWLSQHSNGAKIWQACDRSERFCTQRNVYLSRLDLRWVCSQRNTDCVGVSAAGNTKAKTQKVTVDRSRQPVPRAFPLFNELPAEAFISCQKLDLKPQPQRSATTGLDNMHRSASTGPTNGGRPPRPLELRCTPTPASECGAERKFVSTRSIATTPNSAPVLRFSPNIGSRMMPIAPKGQIRKVDNGRREAASADRPPIAIKVSLRAANGDAAGMKQPISIISSVKVRRSSYSGQRSEPQSATQSSGKSPAERQCSVYLTRSSCDKQSVHNCDQFSGSVSFGTTFSIQTTPCKLPSSKTFSNSLTVGIRLSQSDLADHNAEGPVERQQQPDVDVDARRTSRASSKGRSKEQLDNWSQLSGYFEARELHNSIVSSNAQNAAASEADYPDSLSTTSVGSRNHSQIGLSNSTSFEFDRFSLFNPSSCTRSRNTFRVEEEEMFLC